MALVTFREKGPLTASLPIARLKSYCERQQVGNTLNFKTTTRKESRQDAIASELSNRERL